jgi:mono/diheme cytochrome c family protein
MRALRATGLALLGAGLVAPGAPPVGAAGGAGTSAARGAVDRVELPPGPNPFLGQAEAVDEGKQLYGRRCYVCHLSSGGRGPDLHASVLGDPAFVATVLNGRKGTQMPAFKGLVTPEEVLKIRAFLAASTGAHPATSATPGS